MCDVLALEMKDQERIIDENKSFVSYIPQYAHWPFEINIVPKRHFSSIDQMSSHGDSRFSENHETHRATI